MLLQTLFFSKENCKFPSFFYDDPSNFCLFASTLKNQLSQSNSVYDWNTLSALLGYGHIHHQYFGYHQKVPITPKSLKALAKFEALSVTVATTFERLRPYSEWISEIMSAIRSAE